MKPVFHVMNRIMEKMQELIKTLKEISTQQIDPYLNAGSVPETQSKDNKTTAHSVEGQEKLANLVADIKAEFSDRQS